MSIEAVPVIPEGAAPEAATDHAPRSIGRQAVIDTLSRPGARIGLAWLLILAFFSVFGPFVANTHPILMKAEGHWSSPLLRSLTPADVLLLIATAMAVVLSIGRWYGFLVGLLITVATPVVLFPAAYWLVKPPEPVDYTLYRTMISEGKVEQALYTIIPYSPSDR